MDTQLSRVDPRETRDEAVDDELPPEKAAPRLALAPSRCPFCHATFQLESQETCVCATCLARHHATCWRENGSCASCRATDALVPRERVAPQGMPVWGHIAILLLVLGVVTGFAAGFAQLSE